MRYKKKEKVCKVEEDKNRFQKAAPSPEKEITKRTNNGTQSKAYHKKHNSKSSKKCTGCCQNSSCICKAATSKLLAKIDKPNTEKRRKDKTEETNNATLNLPPKHFMSSKYLKKRSFPKFCCQEIISKKDHYKKSSKLDSKSHANQPKTPLILLIKDLEAKNEPKTENYVLPSPIQKVSDFKENFNEIITPIYKTRNKNIQKNMKLNKLDIIDENNSELSNATEYSEKSQQYSRKEKRPYKTYKKTPKEKEKKYEIISQPSESFTKFRFFKKSFRFFLFKKTVQINKYSSKKSKLDKETNTSFVVSSSSDSEYTDSEKNSDMLIKNNINNGTQTESTPLKVTPKSDKINDDIHIMSDNQNNAEDKDFFKKKFFSISSNDVFKNLNHSKLFDTSNIKNIFKKVISKETYTKLVEGNNNADDKNDTNTEERRNETFLHRKYNNQTNDVGYYMGNVDKDKTISDEDH